MRVEQNQHITLFAGQTPDSGSKSERAGQDKKNTVFAGDLNFNQNATLQERMEQRKAQARQQAMKIVGDVFAADRAMDDEMEGIRGHVRELQQEKLECQRELDWYNDEQERLKEVYGVTDDSDEQKELELLRKCEDGSATPEECEQAEALKQRGLTEYQSRQLELDKAKAPYQETIDKNDKLIEQENRTLEGMRLERLKKSPMVKAQKQAEELLDAARDEIIGMAVEAGKDHIDEESEERKEQAEKVEEEKEKKEEFIEKQKEKREKEEEELLENMPVTEMLALDELKTDTKQELQEMLSKLKLVAEDIKGAAVDETL
ncbi:MAG: hypothetical protein NC092_12090 [Butyrivibrio sp.]|nr:hypothetical protein [Muribaculum sp.]MCM1553419.1 hypothetical protein [Butyrivibrio sp.]